MKQPADDQVFLVTSARQAHSEEMSGRTQRYLISMGIRTVCLVLAIFVASGILRWVFVGAAVVLPWVAVILANAAPAADDEQPEFITFDHPELDASTPTAVVPDDGQTQRTA
jgi:hypothetical protein